MTTPPPQSGDADTSDPNSGDKQSRLTEAEKKLNHIASEQKRRKAIRDGFDRLTELVPGIEGQARSESIVLQRSVEYMRNQVIERMRLVREIEKLGGVVPEGLRGEEFEEKPRRRG
ncbi:MAG: hypothetical protein M4579_005713 [Chaenotheca gracillima]|nr:MAG: hypothetical protein M4579_005713 [Chaenotheca gracillima]